MSSANASDSSSTAITPIWSYDVFLSFRGEDTRKGFVDHLYTTLREKGIDTFKDDIELRRGSSISPVLKNAIERSKVALVVFSKNYADSSWCLDEIVQIVECNKKLGQKIYPVFYHVEPSHVRKQKKSYKKAFDKYENDPNVEKEKIESWRNALKEAASVSGWDIKETDGHESKGIRTIALDILNSLSHTVSRVKESLIGAESHVQKVMSLLNLESTEDVRMIGIWGMGGIGKTTIARTVFDQIFSKFEGSSYLDNVREVSKTLGLNSLEEKLLSDTLMEKSANLHNNVSALFTRLRHKRVLVVLDDVNELEHLDRLAGGHDWFGAGSRIIITTRDRQLLSAREVNEVYEVSFLGTDVALKLFSKFAFKEGFPKEKFEKLARAAVRYARGLPLALKVLGSFLRSRDIDEWEIALDRLEEIPEDKVLEKLKVSFDALNDMEKKIFLDIACLFKGKKKEYVMRKLDSFGLRAKIGVSDLIQKSLLTVTADNRLQMHNLLQEMGWYIVRHSHPNEPGRHSRLWLPKEISSVLTKNSGTEDIEGIHLDYGEPESVKINPKAFTNMKNLRLLKIHNACIQQMPASIPRDLQWLDLHKYQTRTLPPSFQGEKLVGLKLSHSYIEHLGGLEKAQLNKLKFINLSYSKQLVKTPDFSKIPNLERLDLSNCKSLEEVHSSLGNLKKLLYLNLAHCIKLKTLPSGIHLEMLKTLVLWDCVKLEKFPEVTGEMECLSELHLEGTAIKELPLSISNITGLVLINLSKCKNLKSLPNSICDLKCLQTLNLSDCLKLEKLPENLGEVKSLAELLVDGTAITQPPPSIACLTNLNILSFSRCKRPKSGMFSGNLESSVSSISGMLHLQKLGLSRGNQTKGSLPPTRPSLSGLCSLKKLDLSSCDLLEEISADLDSLSSLEELDLSRNNFVEFPAKISELPRLKIVKLESCTNLESLPDFPKSIAVVNADDCHSLKSLANLSEKHAFLRKVSFLNCFKLFENEENHNAADKLLHSLLQGQAIINSRFSILIPGREVPEWFSYQKMGRSVTIPITPEWHNNVIGIAVSIVFERLVSKSKIGITFKMISRDHEEFIANITQTATKLEENYESAHVWIGYVSFHLFQLLFPKFQSDDWAKIEGCLTISTMEEAWIKPRGCGIRLVYKDEVKEALAQHMETQPGVDQELNKSKEDKESIDVLTFGVNQLNWSVDPVEEEGTQFQSLRSTTSFKVQKTLSFDY
ncbi:TMV resistance N-like [Olea europaea subsp. europaea]|uniref:ADP-ribosyl cyclase/cyclic ADP-ribose hydrolase n=1 Tax=Olea europaea subsp. europaea TaxID=158383 RepID=A0A8S0RSW9_OLEEU|nr:TMV resistance N-like [Olea europaea subsp. europaea]